MIGRLCHIYTAQLEPLKLTKYKTIFIITLELYESMLDFIINNYEFIYMCL